MDDKAFVYPAKWEILNKIHKNSPQRKEASVVEEVSGEESSGAVINKSRADGLPSCDKHTRWSLVTW